MYARRGQGHNNDAAIRTVFALRQRFPSQRSIWRSSSHAARLVRASKDHRDNDALPDAQIEAEFL